MYRESELYISSLKFSEWMRGVPVFSFYYPKHKTMSLKERFLYMLCELLWVYASFCGVVVLLMVFDELYKFAPNVFLSLGNISWLTYLLGAIMAGLAFVFSRYVAKEFWRNVYVERGN